MEKVLDESGLKQVWNKIEERSLPVKYLNQNEYDKLSKEEKEGTLFIVDSIGDPDSFFPFGNADIYSMEETRIGTWTDGRPLYRKVFKFTSPGSTNSSAILVLPDEIDSLVNSYGSIENTYGYKISLTMNKNVILYYNTSTSPKELHFFVQDSSILSTPVILVAEYTKTTDEPDNAMQTLVSDLKIEEYDTIVDGCNWHVRKWSNGTVELWGRRVYDSVAIDTQAATNYFSSQGNYYIEYPISLSKLYTSHVNIKNSTSGGANLTVGYQTKDENKYTNDFGFWRPTKSTVRGINIVVYVFGRWK